MDEAVRQKIAAAAHTERGWKPGEVRVDEVERLRRPSCSFFTASHTRRPLPYQVNYALLAGNAVVAISDAKAVETVLDACGESADAAWIAEVITRFHAKLGAGIVLADAGRRPDVVRRLAEAGQAFATPELRNADGGFTLAFLVLDPESNAVARVEAKRRAKGAVEVVKTKLL